MSAVNNNVAASPGVAAPPPILPPSATSMRHGSMNGMGSNNNLSPLTPLEQYHRDSMLQQKQPDSKTGRRQSGYNKPSHFSTPSDGGGDARRDSYDTNLSPGLPPRHEPVTPIGGSTTTINGAQFPNAPIPPQGTPSRYFQHCIPRRPPFGKPILTLHGIKKSFPVNNGKDVVTALEAVNLHEDDGFDATTGNVLVAGGTGGGTTAAASSSQQQQQQSGTGGDGEDQAVIERPEKVFGPIRKGEFIMIRGPSGGGKTTLLNIIGTIDSPTSGEMVLLGEKITSKSSDAFLADLRLKKVGFVFQTFNLIATMSAVENVELPMTLLGDLTERERKRRAKQLLALVGLRNRIDHLPSELSGGEQQRVTIARALANSPELLLLDEPTGDLDTATTIEIMDLLTKLNHLIGTTLIMVTHNPDIECYADRILFVSDGTFKRQAINLRPQQLDYESYQQYLVEKDKQLTTRVNLNGGAAAPSSPLVVAPAPATNNITASTSETKKNGAMTSPQQHSKGVVDGIADHPNQPSPPPRGGPPTPLNGDSRNIVGFGPDGSVREDEDGAFNKKAAQHGSADSLDENPQQPSSNGNLTDPALHLRSESRPATGQTISTSEVGYAPQSPLDNLDNSQSDAANDPQL